LSNRLHNVSDAITAFLDQEATMSIIFFLNARDDLTAAMKLPGNVKKRSIFLMKKQKGVQLSQKLEQDLIVGDVISPSLDHLSFLAEDVFQPLLTNSKNYEGWPDVVMNDFLKHFHRMNGSVYVVSGQAKVSTIICSMYEDNQSVKKNLTFIIYNQ
jgi:dynein heavy chain